MFAAASGGGAVAPPTGAVAGVSPYAVTGGLSGDYCPRVDTSAAVGVAAALVSFPAPGLSVAERPPYRFPLDPAAIVDDLEVAPALQYSPTNRYEVADGEKLGEYFDFLLHGVGWEFMCKGAGRGGPGADGRPPLLLVTPSNPPFAAFLSLAAQLLFEKLPVEIPAVHFAKPAPLAVFGCGRTSALVFDAGASETALAAVTDGHVAATTEFAFAGAALSARLGRALGAAASVPSFAGRPENGAAGGAAGAPGAGSPAPGAGCAAPGAGSAAPGAGVRPYVTASYDAWARAKTLDDIKAACCRVRSEDATAADAGTEASDFLLPDGTKVDTTAVREDIAECLFAGAAFEATGYALDDTLQPEDDYYFPGFAAAVSNMAQVYLESCAQQKDRAGALRSVVLAGGSTAFLGFADRARAECPALGGGQPLVVQLPREAASARYTSFVGASILCSLGTFGSFTLSRQEYLDGGESAVLRRFS